MNVFRDDPFEVIGVTDQVTGREGRDESRRVQVVWPRHGGPVSSGFFPATPPGAVSMESEFSVYAYECKRIYNAAPDGRTTYAPAIKVRDGDFIEPLELRPYCELF